MRNMLIYAKYLQKGDVFRRPNGRPGVAHVEANPSLTVAEIRDVDDEKYGPGECNPPVKMCIKTSSGGRVTLKEGVVVELLHRPWPKGETMEKMLAKGEAFVSGSPRGMLTVTIRRGRLAQVREVIEAYELGLPIEEQEAVIR